MSESKELAETIVEEIDLSSTEAQLPAEIETSFSQIIINTDLLARAEKLANWMSGSKVTIPKHLQGSVGDCYAIVLQSLQWKMNPFVVAQKTHVVNGTLGYEAQLVNAVLQTSGAIRGRFHYEHRGEGNALETRVGAIPSGENEIVWNEWLKSSDVTTKNSPLWKTNPKQQMGYLQVKNWARAYKPAALLGVYTDDELADNQTVARDITPSKQSPAEIGAASLPKADKGDPVDYRPAIKELEDIARTQGPEPFKAAYKKLSQEAKTAIGLPERDRIKAIADMFAEVGDEPEDDTQLGASQE